MTSIFLNYLLKKVAKRPITLILVYKYLRNLSINSTMILFCLFISVVSKSGSVIQTKHFDIKMSLEIRQAKSFFLTLFSYVFCIFSILRITINCNYLFTKHFNYKTLIYLCQRPPPRKNLLFFYMYKRWVGKGGYVVLLREAVGLAQGGFGETALNTKRLCSLAQLRRASPTSIRQIA